MRNILLNKLTVAGLLLIAASNVLAAENNAPIHIEADTVELDEKTGTSSYTGNVRLTQANLSINADKISVFTSEKKLQKIIADGKPATFKQIYDNNRLPPINAEAKKIIFDSMNNTLTLTDNVILTQGDNQFTGNSINYDIENNVMKAYGDEKSKRVKAVIQLDSVKR